LDTTALLHSIIDTTALLYSTKERHSKPPAKEQLKGKYYDIYPASDLDLVDEAIERVLKRYAKTN
jgi:hypothetical protein